MRAGGKRQRRPGTLATTQFDPERVAPQPCMCDPFRVGCYSGPVTVNDPEACPRLSQVALSGHRRVFRQPLTTAARIYIHFAVTFRSTDPLLKTFSYMAMTCGWMML
jgi:hypothetical protein